MKAEALRDGLHAGACQPRVFLKAAGVISPSGRPKTSVSAEALEGPGEVTDARTGA
jgi:hypothetical protein